MKKAIALLVIVSLFCVWNARAEYRVFARRLNNNRPVISHKFDTPYDDSIFTYNYNAAYLPPNRDEKSHGLLVRCQNITNPSDPYSVGPSVISYVRMKSALEDESHIIFDPLLYTSEVIFPTDASNSYGTEDPRAVLDESTGIYYVLYSAVENSTGGIPISRLSLATTKTPSDKNSYTFHGPIFPDIKWSKSGALLIKKKSPSYLIWGDSSIFPGLQLATTDDLLHYHNQPGVYLPLRNDSFDSFLVEAGPMPLPLSDGYGLHVLLILRNYLFLYNSARHGYPSKKPNWDVQYNVGWIVFDGNDPKNIYQRSKEPILSPQLDWEKGTGNALGLTPNVVFVEGWTPHPTKKDHFIIYYGAADSVVGAAEVRVEIIK